MSTTEAAAFEPFEPELSPDVASRRRGLRHGWTTGTCASAAAKAAAMSLVGDPPREVEVGIPQGRRVAFPVHESARGRAVVVKDAGDDPDCTHGARITAELDWAFDSGDTELHAGDGVGTVTKPGLGLPVGSPAINPVPRRMILAALAEVTPIPLRVTFSVPGGMAMATKTSNERLGILGGISVLGTTGIVRPFSTSAYRASVVQQVDVAAAQGETTLVLATGSRSDELAARLFPHLDRVCFVEVGDFTGIALRRAAAAGMRQVMLVAMAGKLTKLAAGVMMTHFHRSKIDNELMAAVAQHARAPAPVLKAATATATARHFFEVCVDEHFVSPLEEICRRARQACEAHAGGSLGVEVFMVDFEAKRVVAHV